MNRVIFFIDGFNVYHALDADNSLHKYKWINYSKLARQFITKDSIQDIYLFTALAHWNFAKVRRHKILIKAQEHFGVKIVYGKFKPVNKYCNNCKTYYDTHEEKQTDVNIAISLLNLAIEDRYDKAIIISGDSDLVPAVRAVKDKFPLKKFQIIIPINRKAKELTQVCDSHAKMKIEHLITSRFDNVIAINENEYLQCPTHWW